ncbi:molybdopterin molybdotransferase MoeA [Dermacoccus nishinomiyaensis]
MSHAPELITDAEHLARILAAVPRLPARRVALADGGWVGDVLGRALAADVCSGVDLPGFTNSAMDGYALRAGDAADGELPVVGDIPAGDTRELTCAPGEAWRIMTGAPVPSGTTTVVPVEQSDGGLERVRFTGEVEDGRHIRRRGEDVRIGDVLLRAGTIIAPQHVAVIASAGVDHIEVAPRPRVVVLSTGDELRPAGEALQHGQIHDSNGPMLAGLVAAVGAELVEVAHVRDDAGEVARVLERAVATADAVITTGGVSAGAYDVVKAALIEAGEVTFDKVAMQPGKPQGFGLLGERGVPVFTLPGNPMSTLVSFWVFVAPALAHMSGRPAPVWRRGVVRGPGWTCPRGRAQYARVHAVRGADGELAIRANARQGSHHLGELGEANALARVPREARQVETGEMLDVLVLDGPIDAPLAGAYDENVADEKE